MLICKKCNKENSDFDSKCYSCGEDLDIDGLSDNSEDSKENDNQYSFYSLILGIIAIVFPIFSSGPFQLIFSIVCIIVIIFPGIIFGFLSLYLSRKYKNSSKKGYAIIGLILCALSLGIEAIIVIMGIIKFNTSSGILNQMYN